MAKNQNKTAHKREVPLAHPGEILNEEFIKPLDLTVTALALALRVPANRLYAIVDGSGVLSLTQPCASPAISARLPISG
jgi:plasmid maintenance system antidote protein VapI